MEYISYRMDAFTRKKYDKNLLLRFVVVDSKIIFDESKTMKGRGFYLLKENVEMYFIKGAGKRYNKDLDSDFFLRFEDDK